MTLYFVRHWQTKNNLENKMNPGDDNDKLTDVWREQAQKAGNDLKKSNITIDIIISSCLSRARETAEIIAKEIWYFETIYQDTRLREQNGWVFRWRWRDEIKQEFWLESNYDFRKLFKSKEYNKVEDITEFDVRVLEFLTDLKVNFPNKNILLAGHSWTSRALLRHVQNLDFEEIYFQMPGVENAKVINLETYKV